MVKPPIYVNITAHNLHMQPRQEFESVKLIGSFACVKV